MNNAIYPAVIVLLMFDLISATNNFLIDNCDDGNSETVSGGWWYTYDDHDKQGNSVVWPKPHSFTMSYPGADGKGYAARMKATAGNMLGWDYAGIGFLISRETGCPINKPMDISAYRYLQFKAKGKLTGGRLTITLPYMETICRNGEWAENVTLTEWSDYEAGITSKINEHWTTLKLDLRKDFRQPRWAKPVNSVDIERVLKAATSFSFHFSSPDGDSVDLWIDDIELVK